MTIDPMTFLGAIVAILTLAGTIWWRIHSMIRTEAREIGEEVAILTNQILVVKAELANHRTHVAETYISKTGLQEAMQPMTAALTTMNASLLHLQQRIDGFVDRYGRGA